MTTFENYQARKIQERSDRLDNPLSAYRAVNSIARHFQYSPLDPDFSTRLAVDAALAYVNNKRRMYDYDYQQFHQYSSCFFLEWVRMQEASTNAHLSEGWMRGVYLVKRCGLLF